MEKHQSIHNQDLERKKTPQHYKSLKKNKHKNANIKLLGERMKHIT